MAFGVSPGAQCSHPVAEGTYDSQAPQGAHSLMTIEACPAWS
jgi:hypothetical protein